MKYPQTALFNWHFPLVEERINEFRSEPDIQRLYDADGYEFEADDTTTDLALVRRAKKLCGLSGQRSTTESWGDMLAIRMTHSCQIIFVTWRESA